MNKQITKTLKVGQHRGHARVWIQGLGKMGWEPGVAYTIDRDAENGCIDIYRDSKGDRKVAAPSKNGVIDLSDPETSKVWENAGSPETYIVEIQNDAITIRF